MTTNLFVGLVAVIYPIAYLFVQPARGLRQRFVLALTDLAAFLVGAAALLIALGFHAQSNGGQLSSSNPKST